MNGLSMDGYQCLLVMAEEPVSRLIEACLGAHGMCVTACATARQAIEVLRDPTKPLPHVCILDEDTAADQDTEEIVALAKGASVFGLAADPAACAEKWREAGVRCLGKPFSPPNFTIAVRAALAADHGLCVEPGRPTEWESAVLDLCSGSGFSTCIAADGEGENVLLVGVDRAPDAIMRARECVRLIGYENIVFVAGDVTALPFKAASFARAYGTEHLHLYGLTAEAVQQAMLEVERVNA